MKETSLWKSSFFHVNIFLVISQIVEAVEKSGKGVRKYISLQMQLQRKKYPKQNI